MDEYSFPGTNGETFEEGAGVAMEQGEGAGGQEETQEILR